jgi:uncharacterized phage protein (TIGR02218 family)
MRTIPNALASHLGKDATTTCYCWRVKLSDGSVLGFTDHDEVLSFGGLTYQAASGFHASDHEAVAGFAASSSEIAGGFSSEALREDDLSSGRYDGAKVEIYLVNWQEPSEYMLLDSREVGEVSRAGGYFQAELRSIAHRLNQPQGRTYGRRCDATFGDERCKVNLASHRVSGTIAAALSVLRFRVNGLTGQTAGRFRFGKLSFTSGANQGLSFDIEDHVTSGSSVELLFWIPPERDVSVGDTFQVVAGCDKSFGMCRGTFSNQPNFQGFPHMPGSDFAYSYVNGHTVHDGKALF